MEKEYFWKITVKQIMKNVLFNIIFKVIIQKSVHTLFLFFFLLLLRPFAQAFAFHGKVGDGQGHHMLSTTSFSGVVTLRQ